MQAVQATASCASDVCLTKLDVFKLHALAELRDAVSAAGRGVVYGHLLVEVDHTQEKGILEVARLDATVREGLRLSIVAVIEAHLRYTVYLVV